MLRVTADSHTYISCGSAVRRSCSSAPAPTIELAISRPILEEVSRLLCDMRLVDRASQEAMD